MCTVCGCGSDEVQIEGEKVSGEKTGAVHFHRHDHPHHHHGIYLDHGPAHSHAPGLSETRMVQIEQDILAKNNRYATANRRWFDERGIFALNLVSSPGSGKTALLCKTIEQLTGEVAIRVIEGDQQTSNDAERIRATGVPALQINTGKGCHLDGHAVGHGLERLQPPNNSLFLIENVGNLVCPAAFDLGEHHKVAILSVTEGEDKPLKYPDMFIAADVLLLNKCDLLPHLQFDIALAEANARRINPNLRIMRISANTGEGLAEWIDWIRAGLTEQRKKQSAAGPTVLIPLATGFEELEAITLIDLLRRAGITVVSAGLSPGPVQASRGTIHLPDTDLDQALNREYDMVVLPGGLPGSDHLAQDPRIIQLLQQTAQAGRYTAAICAAPKVLAAAGLLAGRRATAYPGVLEALQLPTTTRDSAAVVVDERVITSRGPGTAMDFALTLIERLMGESTRQEVETGLTR